MPNNLTLTLSQSKETFREARIYLLTIFKTKENVLAFEEGHIDRCIPYYIQFIESKGIDFNNVLSYYAYIHTSTDFWDLLKASIVGCFNKIETNDLNFIPF